MILPSQHLKPVLVCFLRFIVAISLAILAIPGMVCFWWVCYAWIYATIEQESTFFICLNALSLSFFMWTVRTLPGVCCMQIQTRQANTSQTGDSTSGKVHSKWKCLWYSPYSYLVLILFLSYSYLHYIPEVANAMLHEAPKPLSALRTWLEGSSLQVLWHCVPSAEAEINRSPCWNTATSTFPSSNPKR